MERREPLRRKTPLKATANTLRRAAPKPGRPKRRERIPPNVRERAIKRNRGKCIVCQRRVRLQIHHVLPVAKWPELTTTEANLVGCCERCHMNHEAASRRIRWDELPQCAIALAYSTSGAAAMFLERHYPRG